MADKTVNTLYGENRLDDLVKESVALAMYNQSEVKPLANSIKFLIVSDACNSILGLRASEHLQLLTINKHCNAVKGELSQRRIAFYRIKMCFQEKEH